MVTSHTIDRVLKAATLIETTREEVTLRGEGIWITVTEWAKAVLYNGLGRYDLALAAAEQGSENPDELGLATWSLVELIEAATRTGSPSARPGPCGAWRSLQDPVDGVRRDQAFLERDSRRAMVE